MAFAKISYQIASKDYNPKWDLFSYRQPGPRPSPYTKAQKTIGGASLGGFSRPTPNKVPNVGSSTSVLKRLLPESSFLLLSL